MWWRRLAEVQTEYQNGEERGFKWLWTWNGSCVEENALLMSDVRGEWADWLEMIERYEDDSVSVEELDWSAESQILIPAEHLWCDFKCRP